MPVSTPTSQFLSPSEGIEMPQVPEGNRVPTAYITVNGGRASVRPLHDAQQRPYLDKHHRSFCLSLGYSCFGRLWRFWRSKCIDMPDLRYQNSCSLKAFLS